VLVVEHPLEEEGAILRLHPGVDPDLAPVLSYQLGRGYPGLVERRDTDVDLEGDRLAVAPQPDAVAVTSIEPGIVEHLVGEVGIVLGVLLGQLLVVVR